MARKEKHENPHPTIQEAVATLSSIAEMEFDISLMPSERADVTLNWEEPGRPVTWLQMEGGSTVDAMKEIFHVILQYLRSYYKKEYRYMPNQHMTEGIKAIMVLVGEAAKQLDKHPELLSGNKVDSIMQLKEYKRLQDFYLTHISKEADQGILSRWIMALFQKMQAERAIPKPEYLFPTAHAFVDLESVKKDTAYELFFIRKEDGSHFFSPRLVRNIKLVCDFGDRPSSVAMRDDPLESIKIWQDHRFHACAKDILNAVAPIISQFHQEIAKLKEKELGMFLNKALMALLLCSNSHNLLHDPTVKSCADYFYDFRFFLRQALHSPAYQKLIAYPPTDSTLRIMLNLAHALCLALYTSLQGYQVIMPNINGVLEEAHHNQTGERKIWQPNHSLSDYLATSYSSFNKLLKGHPNGPLIKVLDFLEEGPYSAFDPLMQDNLPNKLFVIDMHNRHISCLHFAVPIYQEAIHKGNVIEEFKGYLRALASKEINGKHLIINLQDRTSWREHTRCSLLEEMQKHPDFAKQLVVVTLPKDTEFYHQEAPYNQENHANVFMAHFKEQLSDENCGFFYPKDIKEALFPEFIDRLLMKVHEIFFGGRNVLLKEHRQVFIDLVYLFLELKLIELTMPHSFSLTSKDGLDDGMASATLIFLFLEWMHKEHLTIQEIENVNMMLYALPIMTRERAMLSDRFHRFLSTVKVIEAIRKGSDWHVFAKLIEEEFTPFFNSDILLANIVER